MSVEAWMVRLFTPIAFVFALVAQLLPAAPCQAHDQDGCAVALHEQHDDGAGCHDDHWYAPTPDETRGDDGHDAGCRCPCHASRAATVNAAQDTAPVAAAGWPPAAEYRVAPGHLETDRPPPRA